jgi:5'-3' exonuclease
MIHFDGDALVYIAGFAADSRNGPFSHSAHNIKLIINKALDVTGEDDYRIFLTSKDPEVNFRTKILPSYKKNRAKICKECKSTKMSAESYIDRIAVKDGIMKRRYYNCTECNGPVADSKPVYYNKIRQYLVEKYGALICSWGEADDWMAPGKPSWIATHDKDIYQIGHMNYYNLKSGDTLETYDELGKIFLTDKKTLKGYGFKWFCAQMLMGDIIDNIPKPYKGDGPVWIYNVFGKLNSLEECWKMVKVYYNGTNNNDKLWTMAQLLWVARKRKQPCTADVIEEMINL